ncbi:MAG: endonuclease III [Tissierellia bacterium]|nr:endonuclease III [Tissierellia bacterium]
MADKKRYYLRKDEKEKAIDIILNLYPDAKAELNFTNAFELLIATILSAQCTDVRVNIVTDKLFEKYKSPEDYIRADIRDLEEDIRTCGLYKSKAKNIKLCSQQLIEKFNSQVPSNLDDLQSLAGVGRKTANVVASNAFGIPAIAVDTHVFRVSNRIGLAKAKDVLNTELQLQKAIPKDKWTKAHHALIFHGRRVCSARNPKCDQCPVSDICLFYKNSVKR